MNTQVAQHIANPFPLNDNKNETFTECKKCGVKNDNENEIIKINPCNHDICKNCYLEIFQKEQICSTCSLELDDFKLEATPDRIKSDSFWQDNIEFFYSYKLGTQLSTDRKLNLSMAFN